MSSAYAVLRVRVEPADFDDMADSDEGLSPIESTSPLTPGEVIIFQETKDGVDTDRTCLKLVNAIVLCDDPHHRGLAVALVSLSPDHERIVRGAMALQDGQP